MARARVGQAARVWSAYAYAARYGMQPLSEIRRMTIADLERFNGELSKIVKVENGQGGD